MFTHVCGYLKVQVDNSDHLKTDFVVTYDEKGDTHKTDKFETYSKFYELDHPKSSSIEID